MIPIKGTIYNVADRKISLLPAARRNLMHDFRPFLVISGSALNDDNNLPTVMGIPISSQTNWKTKFCVPMGAGESGLLRKSWIRVPALQPLEKMHLEKEIGILSPEKLIQVHEKIILMLELL